MNSGLLYAKLLDITWYKRKMFNILFQCCVGMYSSRFSCTVTLLFWLLVKLIVLLFSWLVKLFCCHSVSFNKQLWEIKFKKNPKKRTTKKKIINDPLPSGTTKPYKLCEVKILNVCMLFKNKIWIVLYVNTATIKLPNEYIYWNMVNIVWIIFIWHYITVFIQVTVKI